MHMRGQLPLAVLLPLLLSVVSSDSHYSGLAQELNAPPAPAPAPSPSPPAGADPTAATASMRTPTAAVVLLNFTTEFSGGGSEITVGEAPQANTLAVQFRFAACSGTSLHHHSGTEVMQAVNGSISVGIVSLANTFAAWNFTAGQMVVIPAGFMHFYMNRGCGGALLVATWPAGTKTVFELPALAAVPPSVFGGVMAATPGPAPSVKPGFPIATDPDCQQRCGLAGAPPPASPAASALYAATPAAPAPAAPAPSP